jgi:hypothetical protein
MRTSFSRRQFSKLADRLLVPYLYVVSERGEANPHRALLLQRISSSTIIEHEENTDAFHPRSLESVGNGLDRNRRLWRYGAGARGPRQRRGS